MGGGGHGKRRVSTGGSSGSGSSSGGISSAVDETKKRETQRKLTDYINETGIDTVRRIATIYDPTLGTAIKVAQFVYENKEELKEAYSEIYQTWSSDASLEEKIADTASTVVHTTATIAKKEGKDVLIKYAASELSDAAVEVVEREGIFDKMDSALNIPGAGERFKDLLHDTIEKETENSLKKMKGA